VNRLTEDGEHGGVGAGRGHSPRAQKTPLRAEGTPPPGPDAPVLAVVSDLFFVARIRETGRLAGVPVEFARTPEQVQASLDRRPRLVVLDLTAGYDYERLFAVLDGAPLPVLGFTTHALARQTQPWHSRCDRVVTKETLTQELPRLLKEGVTA